jgi:hypothetical protein
LQAAGKARERELVAESRRRVERYQSMMEEEAQWAEAVGAQATQFDNVRMHNQQQQQHQGQHGGGGAGLHHRGGVGAAASESAAAAAAAARMQQQLDQEEQMANWQRQVARERREEQQRREDEDWQVSSRTVGRLLQTDYRERELQVSSRTPQLSQQLPLGWPSSSLKLQP